MSQLTKEYFDEALKGLATKEDLENFATKDDVQNAVKEGVEDVARIINTAFQEHQDNFLQEQFDRLYEQQSFAIQFQSLTKRVEELEKHKA